MNILSSFDKPTFSVIIPLYNKELSLPNTLKSVLDQSLQDFEVIIVNDGSTDGSLILAKAFSEKDSRIRVESQENKGVSAARNLGISKAKAELLAFLDADDNWEPKFLEEMHSLVLKYPSCGMYGCAYKAVKRNKILLNCHHLPEGIIQDYFQAILQDKISCASAKVVKKAVVDTVGGFPLGMTSGEDYYMWSKIAAAYDMAFTPKILASYNLVYGNTSGRIGRQDFCTESWYSLYKSNEYYRNEFIAKKAIDSGIRQAWGAHTKKSKEIEEQFQYTTLFKKRWKRLYLLNRIPRQLIPFVLLYKKLQTYYYMNFSSKV